MCSAWFAHVKYSTRRRATIQMCTSLRCTNAHNLLTRPDAKVFGTSRRRLTLLFSNACTSVCLSLPLFLHIYDVLSLLQHLCKCFVCFFFSCVGEERMHQKRQDVWSSSKSLKWTTSTYKLCAQYSEASGRSKC